MNIPRKITIRELYDPAMTMTDQAVADEYLAMLIDRQVIYFNRTKEAAETVEKQNLGYYAGYYDAETRSRVERLFKCAHPYFGTDAEHGQPTADMAFNIGKAAGGGVRKPAKK